MRFKEEFDAVRALVRSAQRPEDAQARVVLYLYENFGDYDWVGIYRLEGTELLLGPWQGNAPTEHVRIPAGQGVCGACALSGRTELVPDVSVDPRYLACFSETKSEVVVPITVRGRFWGEIDIDSSTPGAFSPADVEFLEAVAGLLAGML
ncbi:MAG TPA: GAF domain-containing protein [candidate division WOR-3 bacterium]|uniref:GAF domain-containing protein n=1 Tax=candidate division WOR-3 bacterium TaxID=2052148 RepID=A0A7V0T743_UNCW3|nr:GAF domain-containing protein [candidate division WOR-3 bacterium]